jgi:hypothetical protein
MSAVDNSEKQAELVTGSGNALDCCSGFGGSGGGGVDASGAIINQNESIFKQKNKYIEFLENKLDTDLGFYFWKKYIAQISMPVNLTITLLTALTTAQATSPDLLPHNVYVNISIATLLITVLNTFFTPHSQMTKNIEIMKKWNEMGAQFEEAYYSQTKYDDVEGAITSYKNIQKEMNDLRQLEGPETMNFLTDLIHLVAKLTCLRNHEKWLDNDRTIMNQKTE